MEKQENYPRISNIVPLFNKSCVEKNGTVDKRKSNPSSGYFRQHIQRMYLWKNNKIFEPVHDKTYNKTCVTSALQKLLTFLQQNYQCTVYLKIP